MQSILRYALILFLGIFLLTACTIQRRTFNKGWHIEWKTKLKVNVSESFESTAEVNNDKENHPIEAHDSIRTDLQHLPTGTDSILDYSAKTLFETAAKPNYTSEPPSYNTEKALTKTTIQHIDDTWDDSSDEGINTAAIASLILGIISLILLFTLGITWPISILISLLTAIAGIVFGGISLNRNGSYGQGKLRILGVLGLIFSIVDLGIIIFGFILFLLFLLAFL